MVETIVFLIAAAGCLGGAVGVVLSRQPVYSALSLVGTLFSVAVIFVGAEAHFLAVVQVIVYAGAIVVLFLFVIMLLGVDQLEDLSTDPVRIQRPAAALFAVVSIGILAALALSDSFPTTGEVQQVAPLADETPNVERLALSLFSDYVFAFELTSALLVIAVVGAVVLARRGRLEEEVSS